MHDRAEKKRKKAKLYHHEASLKAEDSARIEEERILCL